ncbi:unnamed protein product, partial [Rangifer tarandus platyrhynchus]
EEEKEEEEEEEGEEEEKGAGVNGEKILHRERQPERFTELHEEWEREEGDRGEQEEKKGTQEERDRSTQLSVPKVFSCVLVAQLYPTLQPHGMQPPRLLCPWDAPGKNTG